MPVRRDGLTVEVRVEEIVRGDLLVLRAGVFVAADARLVDAQELTVDESSLTGESVPVLKSETAAVDAATPLVERRSMVYRGTLVTGGSGHALVVAVADHTEIGHVHRLATSVQARKTPMQNQLDRLGTQLAIGSSLACVATLVVGAARGQALLPMFRTAISLGVAAVPEGLPTVAITTLALGLSRMREQRVIVRRLAAVETLGAVQVVCFDKTGTLTVNRMTVVEVQAGLRPLRAEAGALCDAGGQPAAFDDDLQWLLRVAVLCNEVELSDEAGVFVLRGSPTEMALVQLAVDAGVAVAAERAHYALLEMQRRTQTRNFMASLHERAGERLLVLKGRPSEVLSMCSAYVQDGQRLPLGPAQRALIETHNEQMAGRALRVLGLAYCEHEGSLGDEPPRELTWVGLIGMQDPARPGVTALIDRFHRAGVRTIMITGDQSATALAVARQVGLAADGHLEIVDSTSIDRIEPDVLSALAQRAHVFSRVSPANKLQIVQALQRAGHVVAMTGDGVNDGPALKAADIGIAMGSSGTNAARELSDVVLEDDQLETLITAIEQGRTIYEDIRKAVHFILATNLGEILYTLAGAAGLGQPLSPMQLLWINLLTDVFPELALAVEPPESDVLGRPPRDPARPMFTRQDLLRIGGEGAVITLGALSAYGYAAGRGGAGAHASTVGFTALTLGQLLHAFGARSETHGVFDHGRLARNRWLPLSVAATAGLQIAGNVVPALRALLGTTRLSALDWMAVLAAAGVPFVVNEGVKSVRRRALDAQGKDVPPATEGE